MKYLYAGLLPSINFGDYIIEFATQKILRKHFPDDVELLPFYSKGNEPLDHTLAEKVIIPGCTQLRVGQHKALNSIDKDKIKAYCLAGSLWYKDTRDGFLLRNRIINKPDINPDLTIVDKLSGIIGCRDHFTYSFLKKSGYNCLYTGCPTLFLGDGENDIGDGRYVLFSFGRGNYRKQVYYANQIKRHSALPVVGIVHEVGDFERAKAAGWKFPLVDFLGDTELYLSYFKNATYVVTGRLHGALPSLSYGKPVLYFGTKDTRTTIFDDLGIKIFDYSAIPHFEKRSSLILNNEIIKMFSNNLKTVAECIQKD